MAKPPSTGMEKGEMKKLLMKSKQEPVNCAIGLGDDPSYGLLMLDRIKQPKAVEKELVKGIASAKNTRWGTALVDVDDNPKLVKITINKPISSMARKLVKTLKGTGFTKVEILVEADGGPVLVESYAEEDTTAPDEAQAGAPPPPPQAETPKPDAAALEARLKSLIQRVAQLDAADPRREDLTKRARQAGVYLKTNNPTYAATEIEILSRALDAGATAGGTQTSAPPPPPPPLPQAEAPKPDLGALEARLKTLIPRVAQLDAGDPRREDLTKRARQAGVYLKTNNPVYAGTEIEILSRALDTPPPSQPGAQPDASGDGAASEYEKSGKIWLATRKRVEDEIGKLRASILTAYQGTPFVGEIESRFADRTGAVLQTLDGTLATTLEAAAKAKDTAGRAKLVEEAKSVIARYESFAGSDPVLADLDANPFVPLAIQKTVSATLAALSKTLH